MAEKKGKKNIFLIYLFSIITLGIYGIYWMVSTKNEMNDMGAKIPPSWLFIIPIANFYWMYKYSEAFSQRVKKDNNPIMWFILFILLGIIILPAVVQSELNRFEKKPKEAKEGSLGTVGLTLGIMSILLMGILGGVMSIIGFILCLIQQKKKPTNGAETGIIICIIGFVLSLVWIFYLAPILSSWLQSINPSIAR